MAAPTDPSSSRRQAGTPAGHAHAALRSYQVGALPLINHLLARMKLAELLAEHLRDDDARRKIPTTTSLLVLVRNVLLSREAIYGVGEWAARQAPDLLGLTSEQLTHLNDDRLGRSLAGLFAAAGPNLILAVVRHVIHEFQVSLDELHNDSTTVSFYGAYENAQKPARRLGRATCAITYGHSKDHRPDLKQLLYTLTVSEDGGVPVYVQTHSGNTTDDRTHCQTWDLLCQLVGRPDFLYVADCKLVSAENLRHIDAGGGRFVSVLPRGRAADKAFRQRLLDSPERIRWEPLEERKDAQGRVWDAVRVCAEASVEEGWRLWWYHSTAKQQRDLEARTRAIQRALEELTALADRLAGPRTRLRHWAKVDEAVQEILQRHEVREWVKVQIHQEFEERLRKLGPGRPGPNTHYVAEKLVTRHRLTWEIDAAALARARHGDGVFPLITNTKDLSSQEVLGAYRRQPIIERRFSNLKTDFAVAPVWLEDIGRIQGLLMVYFLVLLVQTLLERELRRAMRRRRKKSLPLYPEGKPSSRPTARRVFDVFADVQRHVLSLPGQEAQVLTTELTPLQREIVELLGLSPDGYAH